MKRRKNWKFILKEWKNEREEIWKKYPIYFVWLAIINWKDHVPHTRKPDETENPNFYSTRNKCCDRTYSLLRNLLHRLYANCAQQVDCLLAFQTLYYLFIKLMVWKKISTIAHIHYWHTSGIILTLTTTYGLIACMCFARCAGRLTTYAPKPSNESASVFVRADVKHLKHATSPPVHHSSCSSDTTLNVAPMCERDNPVLCQPSSKTTLNIALLRQCNCWDSAHVLCNWLKNCIDVQS